MNENMNKTCEDFSCEKCPFEKTNLLCQIALTNHRKFKEIIDTLEKEIEKVKENKNE